MFGLARLVGIAVAVALVSGCAGNSAENQATEVHSQHLVVECGDIIDAIPELVPGYAAHGSDGGFVALPTTTLQLGRSGSADTGHEDYRFAKFGLAVRRSRQASLEIVSTPSDAYFDYGSDVFGSANTMTAGPCGSDRGQWVVWAGGIWVNEPGCVELLVSSEDEEIPVWLAVGASCNV